MNRRAFLRSVSMAAASGLLLPEIARELIAPKRTICIPKGLTWLSANWYEVQPLPVDLSHHLLDAMRYAMLTTWARRRAGRFVVCGPASCS